jgi:hypothetical protein
LHALHKYLESNSIRLVVGVVYQGTPPEASKIEEFASVLTRDMNLDPRQLQQLESNPTTPQVLLHPQHKTVLLQFALWPLHKSTGPIQQALCTTIVPHSSTEQNVVTVRCFGCSEGTSWFHLLLVP